MDERGVSGSASRSVIESAIAGDRDALNQLWHESRRWVGAILLAHKPCEAEIEDLLQVVAMQVCRKISTLQEPRAFKSWLRTIAINVAREEGRKTTRRRRSILQLVGMEQASREASASAQTIAADSDESHRIYQAALSLPVGYREPVLLRCVRSMSAQQIGEVLDLPTTTIETRIARGRRMLREVLDQQDQQNQQSGAAQSQTARARAGGA